MTIKADYYVVTSDIGSLYSETKRVPGYSLSEIEELNNSISKHLNNLELVVTNGKYSGYSVVFDLTFIGADQIKAEAMASADNFEGFNIGNTFRRGDKTNSKLRREEHTDGSYTAVGGITQLNTHILMNIDFDTQMNRLHEIFHTFGFDDEQNAKGIMSYPPQNPNDKDVEILMTTPYMPTIKKTIQ